MEMKLNMRMKDVARELCYLKSLYWTQFTYRLKSGLDVYGAATSLIFNTMMAVIKMQHTFTTVSKPETMPLIKNSVGI